MKNSYLSTSIGLYINFFVFGMASIIIALNIDFLSVKWETTTAGVAAVVSSFGIGKLISVLFTGRISDRYGRKVATVLGIFLYLVFLLGILWSPNAEVAYFFGILAGVGNSFLDTGTYPALMEAFPRKPGPANIIVKAFIQAGQFLLPIIVGFLVIRGIWYGWSFMMLVVLLVLNLLFIMTRKFPPMTAARPQSDRLEEGQEKKRKSHFSIEEFCLISFGFVGQTLLYVLGQWIAKYGSEVVGMGENAARVLVSYGSIGALICVLVTFGLGNKGVKSSYIIMAYTVMTTIISVVLWAFPTPMVATVGAFFLGYFSSGGLIQLGLTLLAEHSPRGKGFATSLYTIAEGIALFAMPLVVAAISKVDIAAIFLLNAFVSLLGFSLILAVFIRDKRRATVQQDIPAIQQDISLNG